MNVGICVCVLLAALSSGSLSLPSHATVGNQFLKKTRQTQTSPPTGSYRSSSPLTEFSAETG